MEAIKIKEINLSLVDNKIVISKENPNYIHYNFYTDYDKDNVWIFLTDVLKKTFQEYPITYSFEFVNLNEYKLIVDEIEYKVIYKNNHILCDCFFIHYNCNISNVTIFKDIVETVYRDKQLLKISNEINDKKDKLNSNIFLYKYNYDDKLEYHYVVKYIPNGSNILIKYIDGKFEFVSYLEYEGETYYNGSEILSINSINNKILYYTKILNDIPKIQEELLKI